MKTNIFSGKTASPQQLIDISKLIGAYYSEHPDAAIPTQKVSFGTSGHRGNPFEKKFNEKHILAIAQAIADYRKEQAITGPLFLGIDTHALSDPARLSTLEVLGANGIIVLVDDDYTPTPVISHAILTYNRGRKEGLADGIVITPSHNPPDEGGIKYNPPHGGPAEESITRWIEKRANEVMLGLSPLLRGRPVKKRHSYAPPYIEDLQNVLDMDAMQNLKFAVDPLGGAGVHYWEKIAERYRLNLAIINKEVDSTFRFMPVDWDGKIRMDPSSPYAMAGLIKLKEKYDLAFSCDTDHDRHGIVTKTQGLLPSNHYLSVAVSYLLNYRKEWPESSAIARTVVTTQMIDRIAESHKRKVVETPVGFKWFVDGLYNGSLSFGGEESAGASFSRKDGTVWTTDKDGIILALLSAEMMGRTGKDPGVLYKELEEVHGKSYYERIDSPASPQKKDKLKKLKPDDVSCHLAEEVLTHAPGNGAAIGGIKVIADAGWFAIRPSGTENISKIYAESFRSPEHLKLLIKEAEKIVERI